MKTDKTLMGEVLEILPNGRYLIKFTDGREIQCYSSGKIRLHKIKILIHDMVEVVLDEYGHIGRIVRRK